MDSSDIGAVEILDEKTVNEFTGYAYRQLVGTDSNGGRWTRLVWGYWFWTNSQRVFYPAKQTPWTPLTLPPKKQG